jgi:geranylgeranyl reductase family protein
MGVLDSAVTVLGAGPAGATAARRLALAGRKVRLLDRRPFPRQKPCGGGISLRVLSRFPYLGPALPRIATHTVRRLHLEGPEGRSAVIESARPAALMIRRVEFDDLLVSLAVEAGAELVTGVDIVNVSERGDRLELTARDGREFETDVLIAADGVHSLVGRRLGLNPGWPPSSVALDMMEETPRSALRDIDPSALWVSYGHQPLSHRGKGQAVAEGYAYVFPKRDHVNIGLGYVLSYYRRSLDEAPYDLQREFIDDLRRRHIVEGDSVRGNFTPSLLPVGGPLRRPGRGSVLLAGDAGGFVNSVTAEGIYYAMVSGELAADAINEAARDPRPIADRYGRACDGEIGDELRDSVLLQRYLFADRRRLLAVIDSAPREQALTNLILDFIVGNMSYRTLRRRMLTKSPILLARLLWAHLN